MIKYLQLIAADGVDVFMGSVAQSEWSRLPTAGSGFRRVAANEAVICAASPSGSEVSSDYGASFVAVAGSDADPWQDVVECAGALYAITAAGALHRIDGTGAATSVAAFGSAGKADRFFMASGGGAIVATMGDSGGGTFTSKSTDGGATWSTPAAYAPTGGGANELTGICYAKGAFWISDKHGLSEYSTDGAASWSAIVLDPVTVGYPPGLQAGPFPNQANNNPPLLQCAWACGSRAVFASTQNPVRSIGSVSDYYARFIYADDGQGTIKYIGATIPPDRGQFYTRQSYVYEDGYNPEVVYGSNLGFLSEPVTRWLPENYWATEAKIAKLRLYDPEIGALMVGPHGVFHSWHFGESTPTGYGVGLQERFHLLMPRSNCLRLADITKIRTPWMPRARARRYAANYNVFL